MIKKMRFRAILALIFSLIFYNAYALTQPMTASVSFMAPLAVGSITDPSFGKLSAGVASTVYKLDTGGNVTTISGPGSALGGSPAAGSMTLSGSGNQTVNISATNLIDDNNIIPSAIMCAYDSGNEVSCNDSSLDTAAAPGGGKVLKVGMTITTLGNESDGDEAAPSFDITVVYN